MHRVEDGRMLIALRENPRPRRQAKWPLVPPPLHGDRAMTHTQADIYAPEFPPSTTWINAAFMRMGTLLGPQRGAGLVLGLHEPQLDPRAALRARVAQPLRRHWA